MIDGDCVTFTLGEGSMSFRDFGEGNISFIARDGLEVMRFEPDGRAFVRDELVATNREVYDRFVAWLNGVTVPAPLP